MRRRDFAIGLLLATAVGKARAQEQAKQHRIAIVIPAGPIADISATGIRGWPAFFEELGRLGDVEGKTSPSSGIPARGGPSALPISLARSSAGART
jgi:hypothetical protein